MEYITENDEKRGKRERQERKKIRVKKRRRLKVAEKNVKRETDLGYCEV